MTVNPNVYINTSLLRPYLPDMCSPSEVVSVAALSDASWPQELHAIVCCKPSASCNYALSSIAWPLSTSLPIPFRPTTSLDD